MTTIKDKFPQASTSWGATFQAKKFTCVNLLENKTVDAMLQALLTDGICFVEGIEYGKANYIWDLVKSVFVPEGEIAVHKSFWDARELKEAAYLNQFTNKTMIDDGYHVSYGKEWLPSHTDGTYMSVPPRVKVFGPYEFSGEIIDSVFVDGYHISALLTPEQRNVLSHESVTHWIETDPQSDPMQHDRTIIGTDIDGRQTIAWNAHDRKGKQQGTPISQALNSALEEFERLVNDDSNKLKYKLSEGTAVITDNWRVLHGREKVRSGIRRVSGADISDKAFREICSSQARVSL